jgi:hypothetical protein
MFGVRVSAGAVSRRNVRLLPLGKAFAASVIAASLALPWTTCSTSHGSSQAGYGSGSLAGIPIVAFALWPLAISLYQLAMSGAINRPVAVLDLTVTLLGGLVHYMAATLVIAVGLGVVTTSAGPKVFFVGWFPYLGILLGQIVELVRVRRGRS